MDNLPLPLSIWKIIKTSRYTLDQLNCSLITYQIEMGFRIHPLLVLGLIYCLWGTINAQEEKKDLKIVLDKLEKINDAEHILKTDLKFEKDEADNEVKISGTVEQMLDLGDEHKITINISHCNTEDGEFKTIVSTPAKGVCEVMQNQYKKYFYDTLKDYCSNAPDPEKCPVTKDKYEVTKYPLDSSKFKKYLRPGYYHVVTTLFHDDKEVLQYRVEAHTEEE
ncbi:chemosensory protein A 87a [Haematobia irritans]|uniref:chemosensory protein A 87a n=1 Tax=Haematobia irritans TaxID=7368 RepID=UPI003F4F4B1B